MSEMSDLVNAIIALQPPRKIGADEYVARTPFHPDGQIRVRLRRQSFQNGRRLDEAFMTDAEIRLVNALVPGRFVDGLITVKEVDNGPETQLHLYYRSATQDQRMALMAQGRSLTVLLQRCLSDAVAQGLAPASILANAMDDPMDSMVLPNPDPGPPRTRVPPAVPGRDDVPLEHPEVTGTSAAEPAEGEEDEEESATGAFPASAIDLLAAPPLTPKPRSTARR